MANSKSCNGPSNLYRDQARRFLQKLKTRFRRNPHIYKSFIDIVFRFGREHHSVVQIYKEASDLFVDHSDLLSELVEFLPDTDEAPPPRN